MVLIYLASVWKPPMYEEGNFTVKFMDLISGLYILSVFSNEVSIFFFLVNTNSLFQTSGTSPFFSWSE